MSIDLLAEPVVDFLAVEERRINPPYLCTCEHFLMVHARKIKGIWTNKQGPCHLVTNGVPCECTNAVAVETGEQPQKEK